MPLLAVLLLFATASFAALGQDDLQRQIDQLRAQIRELRAAPSSSPTSADIDSAIAAVRADADARSMYMAGNAAIQGGWADNKFFIRSADGNFSMSPCVFVQFRYNANTREDHKHDQSAQTDDGFELRRMKLSLEGHLFSPDFTYFFLIAIDRHTGDFVNEELSVRYHFAKNWSLWLGQYKENITQEQAVSAKKILAVDRSLMNELINQGESFVQGVQIEYDDLRDFRALLGFTDGYSSRNTNFRDPPVNPFNFGVNGRVVYKFFGDGSSSLDFTPLGNKRPMLAASAAFDFSQSGDANVIRHGADLHWENDVFTVFGGGLARYTSRGDGSDSYDWGLMTQAVFLINSSWDCFARYDFTHLDHPSVARGARNDYQEITVGVNCYFKSHFAKITADLLYFPNGAPTNLDGAAILASDQDQWVIRAQFQLVL